MYAQYLHRKIYQDNNSNGQKERAHSPQNVPKLSNHRSYFREKNKSKSGSAAAAIALSHIETFGYS